MPAGGKPKEGRSAESRREGETVAVDSDHVRSQAWAGHLWQRFPHEATKPHRQTIRYWTRKHHCAVTLRDIPGVFCYDSPITRMLMDLILDS